MKQHAILVINSGSSSVKFQVIEPASKKTLIKGLLESICTDRCCLTSSLGKKALPFAGYEEAINKQIEIGRIETNKHHIFIRFECKPINEI